MHLPFFIIFGIFLHNNISTESRKVSPDGVVYDGFKADAFRRITTHLIETNIVNKLGLCAFKCLKKLECVSFNFGNPFNGQHVCELLRTDKYNSRSSYVTSTDFHNFYYENKCMNPSLCQNNGLCYPDYDNNEYKCVCHGTNGRNCEICYHNCSEILQAGLTTSGVYHIDPDGQGSFPVYCDMTTDGGGWTVFHKRFNGSVGFYRGWQDYKTGFGNLNGEFWLGLENIYRLTKTNRMTALRVELEDKREKTGYAMYSSFAIADESDFYRLTVGGYSGTAGDSLGPDSGLTKIHNGMQFSTLDKDNDLAPGSCSESAHGASWWYVNCYSSSLNGEYIVGIKKKGIIWRSFNNDLLGLRKAQMKLK